MGEVERIAQGLTTDQYNFLITVCDGRELPLASRRQDRARQALRRCGLVHVVKNPQRWEPLPLGLAVREYLKGTRT
jgi:hypothetical protein